MIHRSDEVYWDDRGERDDGSRRVTVGKSLAFRGSLPITQRRGSRGWSALSSLIDI